MMIKNMTNEGFTLVELVVTLAITSIVMAGIFSSYYSQQNTFVNQQQFGAMQQEVRAAMFVLRKEIRMAGYQRTQSPAGAGLVVARPGLIQFSKDYTVPGGGASPSNGDLSDANDNITLGFANADDTGRDGLADAGVAPLGRARSNAVDSSFKEIAGNMKALGFAYAYEDVNGQLAASGGQTIWAIDSNADGKLDKNLDTNTDGVIDANDTPGGADLGFTVPLNRVRVVRAWVLARTQHPVRNYTETQTFVVGDKRITPNDNYKHLLAEIKVDCRNIM